MNPIELSGCTPEPLMNYLKALGVLRLVAEDREHGDPAARLSWSGGLAVLHTGLDRESLVKFFVNHYQPTPIVAPWNGGSGFYGGGSEPLEAIAASTSSRLQQYRETIQALRPLIPGQKPKDDDKFRLLVACRNKLSDQVGGWLDCCFVLREEATSFFPLLGTGGNDGRLDFTNNFFQRLSDVIGFGESDSPPALSEDFLRAAIFADTIVSLGKSAIGQFNPGGIGGPNGIQGRFEADSRVNPWEYILMIEGALLFAGSLARRLGSRGTVKATFPFTVESVAVGYGSAIANEETTDGSRAELWLPLWNAPTSFPEVKQLFSEGRAQFGRQQARNAVEFALAVNLLGVSRGISAFARYGFLKRNGLAFLATPLGRMPVTYRPNARLLEDARLTGWLDRFRQACRDKDKTPLRYQSALRNTERAIFEFANRSETTEQSDKAYLLNILRMLGRAERTLATGLKFSQEKRINPLSGLHPDWLQQANDESAEFRLAAALAGIQGTRDGKVGPIRIYLQEVEVTLLKRKSEEDVASYSKWQPGSTSAVWSNQSLVDNLAAVFRRRQMEAFREGCSGVPLRSSRFAHLDDITSFLRGEIDEEKLEDLLWGLLGVDYPTETQLSGQSSGEIPFEFGCPRLLVQNLRFIASKQKSKRHPKRKPRLKWKLSRSTNAKGRIDSHPDVFHRLSSSRPDAVTDCLHRAALRLKSSGLFVVGYRNRLQSGKKLLVQPQFPPQRLLAAMLFPVSEQDISRIANAVLNPPEKEE